MNGPMIFALILGLFSVLFGILGTWGWILAHFRRQILTQYQEQSLSHIQQIDELQQDSTETKKAFEHAREHNTQLQIQLQEMKTRLELQKEVKEQMTLEFSKISQDILEKQEEKTQKIAETRLSGITSSLRDSLSGFQKQIVEYENKHSENKGYFEKVISDLQKSTNTLAEAFSKDQKLRGTWGEQQLTLILEQSGLVEGRDFDIQVSVEGHDGKPRQIDALLRLPEDRHLVIDVKTPFVNYEKMINTSSDEERNQFQKAFFRDVKAQIQDLASKDYTKSKKEKKSLKAPPVTFMFLPIESAYTLVVESMEIQEFARRHRIMLCSPQTFFALSKTIAFIWQLYDQDQNSIEILRIAKDIVSKAETVHHRILQLEKTLFGPAMHKAFDELKAPLAGKGGVASLGEKLNKLGIPNALKPQNELEKPHTFANRDVPIPHLEDHSTSDGNLELFEQSSEKFVEALEPKKVTLNRL